MAKGLTVTRIENLTPGKKRREIPDGRGLYLILQPTGDKVWALRYRHRGVSRKLTLARYAKASMPHEGAGLPTLSLADARALASRRMAENKAGADPAGERRATREKEARAAVDRRELLENVVADFVRTHAKKKQRTWAETERQLEKHILGGKPPIWRGRRLSSITKVDIHERLDAIQEAGIEARPNGILANRILGHLKVMFGWAVKRGLIEKSPAEDIDAPAKETSRDRVLISKKDDRDEGYRPEDDDQLRHIWEAATAIGWPFEGFIKLLILTGQRVNEVASMIWDEIDLRARLWTLPATRTKNGRENEIHLSAAAMEVIEALPRMHSKSGLVFTTTGRTPISGFHGCKRAIDAHILAAMRKAAKEAGKDIDEVQALPRWVLHDLRRTTASGMARLGTPIHVTEACLNHRSGTIKGIAAVYQHYTFSAEKRDAFERWGRFVSSLVSGKPADNVVELAAVRAEGAVA